MDIIGKRKIWYGFSLLLLVASILSLFVQGLNFGIDFTGGSLIQVDFENEATLDQVRNELANHGLEKSSLQQSAGGVFTIRTVELSEEDQEKVLKGLEENVGKYELHRSEKVGPVIGGELRSKALLALAVAAVLQILYISWRFEFKMALPAIAALLHDALITTGFFSIFQFEVDGAYVAAVLTIIGYSINDTIVIFDRIREGLKNRRKETLAELINTSVRQTLARSINTSLTTLFVLVALFLLGGETTKNFALALLAGISVGAYSSIFLASPLWYDFRGEFKSAKKAA
jgi:preprotein translocase subunit SecF